MAITLKKLSGDTEVVANPTLDGSETALSGLQIDGVKYSMPSGGGSGGGGLYNHFISINASNDLYAVYAYLTITNTDNTKFTYSSLKDLISKNSLFIGVSGSVMTKSSQEFTGLQYLAKNSGTNDIAYFTVEGTSNRLPVDSRTVTDTVVEA